MILITGGTGTAGGEISKALGRMGVRYRSLVRNRAKAAASASPNVDLVEADLSRPETLDAALEGVERALLLTAPSPDAAQHERNFIRAAKRAGVAHVVKFSVYNASLQAPYFFGRNTARESGSWKIRGCLSPCCGPTGSSRISWEAPPAYRREARSTLRPAR